jgi:KipI family sensor histidine kinase inhibitor
VNVLPYGRDAVLLEVASSAEAVSLAAWARARGLARDVVPGARSVLLDHPTARERLDDVLPDWRPEEREQGREVVLPVVYDGPDLSFVAERWGCSVDDAVRRHAGTTFVSAFCGFAPGFAYLEGLTTSVPRLETPRTRVPVGSVGLAGTWCGVYPNASPGGWRLVGRTTARLWDVDRQPPALLAPGTRVRFDPA